MLQICNSTQTWEAVCDYDWYCSAAVVACRQLGYTNSCKHRPAIKSSQFHWNYTYISVAELSTNFGAWDSIGFGPYYCSSSEETLFDCYEERYAQNEYYYCNPDQDTVGLNCNNNSGGCYFTLLNWIEKIIINIWNVFCITSEYQHAHLHNN